jgi:hypothetical protein
MGLFSRLLKLSTDIGVGFERSANGIPDNPLTDLIDDVGDRFGSKAAGIVEYAFGALTEALGPDLRGDGELATLPPDFDVNNGVADTKTVELPDDQYRLDIGSPENVGNGELARIILGIVDRDADDNDIEQILFEHYTGNSGANLDFEFEPGIEGVDVVVAPDKKSFTLFIEDNGGDAPVIDELTISGPGAEAALEKFSDYIDGGTSAPAATSSLPHFLFKPIVGGGLDFDRPWEPPISQEVLQSFVDNVVDELPRIEAQVESFIDNIEWDPPFRLPAWDFDGWWG